MHILLIEPYYGGSHKAWADGYRRHSAHHVTLLPLPAQFWKWRMQGGAVTLTRLYQQVDPPPDVILASDMLNLATFRALTRTDVPIALYFHENQLSYPQNRRQGHGWRYGFINYASALAADAVFFNSGYHRDDFFATLPDMLKHFGDLNELDSVDWLRGRSDVLPVGLNLARLDAHRVDASDDGPPIILWNHRWEADKNPATFFVALDKLIEAGLDFRVVLLGQNFQRQPEAFEAARTRLGDRVLHYGYTESVADYIGWLWRSDYVISTAHHDFFGMAMAEAITCGCIPVLPHRLNYPALVPDHLHDACLYHGYPESLLAGHLRGEISVSVTDLQQHIAQYGWDQVAPRYDAALEALAGDMPSARLGW